MSISIQNYLGAVILTMLACSLPATAYAEVYKCKNPDGTMTYSDQPCPESPGKPKPKLDSDSETWKTVRDLNTKKNVSKEEVDQLMLRYDKDFHENKKRCDQQTLKGCEKLSETLGKLANDLRQACTKAGDKKSCKESCPSTLYDKQGPADDFLACAKGLELTHGDYWLIRQGELSSFGSRRSPTGEEIVLYDKTLIPMKDGRHISTSDLHLLCFRKKKSASEVETDNNSVQQIYYVSSRANDQVIRRAYSIDPKGYGRLAQRPDMSEFPTLEDLANHICPK